MELKSPIWGRGPERIINVFRKDMEARLVAIHRFTQRGGRKTACHYRHDGTAVNFFRKEVKDGFERELRRSSGVLAWMES